MITNMLRSIGHSALILVAAAIPWQPPVADYAARPDFHEAIAFHPFADFHTAVAFHPFADFHTAVAFHPDLDKRSRDIQTNFHSYFHLT